MPGIAKAQEATGSHVRAMSKSRLAHVCGPLYPRQPRTCFGWLSCFVSGHISPGLSGCSVASAGLLRTSDQ